MNPDNEATTKTKTKTTTRPVDCLIIDSSSSDGDCDGDDDCNEDRGVAVVPTTSIQVPVPNASVTPPSPNDSFDSPNKKNENENDNRDDNSVLYGTPQTTNLKRKNAFALIMSSGGVGSGSGSGRKRQRRRTAGGSGTRSRFVACPVCGNHILPHAMNRHLDACLLRQETKKHREKEAKQKQEEKREQEEKQKQEEATRLLLQSPDADIQETIRKEEVSVSVSSCIATTVTTTTTTTSSSTTASTTPEGTGTPVGTSSATLHSSSETDTKDVIRKQEVSLSAASIGTTTTTSSSVPSKGTETPSSSVPVPATPTRAGATRLQLQSSDTETKDAVRTKSVSVCAASIGTTPPASTSTLISTSASSASTSVSISASSASTSSTSTSSASASTSASASASASTCSASTSSASASASASASISKPPKETVPSMGSVPVTPTRNGGTSSATLQYSDDTDTTDAIRKEAVCVSVSVASLDKTATAIPGGEGTETPSASVPATPPTKTGGTSFVISNDRGAPKNTEHPENTRPTIHRGEQNNSKSPGIAMPNVGAAELFKCTNDPPKKNNANENENENDNVFARMMKRSAKVFCDEPGNEATTTRLVGSLPKLFQHMHLRKDGTVTVTCHHTPTSAASVPDASNDEETIVWSARVRIRGCKETATPPIELWITSSVPSWKPSGASSSSSSRASSDNVPFQPERQRLVKHHSKLSVPVLKSILQKSIRRRKPLPSVRVAAELADKSLGDLLRRLPIIVLEDSTLHPGLPFLVWSMVAVSKDYQPPLVLLKKVLGIVFEMASCRWKDSLIPKTPRETIDDSDSKNNGNDPNEKLTLAFLHKRSNATRRSTIGDHHHHHHEENDKDPSKPIGEGAFSVLSGDELMVWSMLMRGRYGGMACDIRMLQGYSELWHERFCSVRRLPDETRKRFLSSSSSSGVSRTASAPGSAVVAAEKARSDESIPEDWNRVPAFVHRPASKQSANRIDRLFMVAMPPTIPCPSLPTENPTENTTGGELRFVGLTRLRRSDITQEGVDFHCSSILESTILRDPKLVGECCDALRAGNHLLRGQPCPPSGTAAAAADPSSTAGTCSRRFWLEGVLKSCMWKYSAGVNLRLPLVVGCDTKGDQEGSDDGRSSLRDFYETRIEPRAKAFSERYVNERLSKAMIP